MTITSSKPLRRTPAGESVQDFLIACNEPNCDNTLSAPDRTWSQMIQFLRNEGWKIYKTGSEWKHRCSECHGHSPRSNHRTQEDL